MDVKENGADDLIERTGDEGDISDWGDYPLDSVMVRNEVRTVSDIIRRIDNKRYIMDPEFQRQFVWKPEQQSRLVESLLMRIPLPVFYLAEQADGRLVVVDGLQRLTTLHKFYHGEFALGLKNQELSGRRFADLSAKLQNRIEDTNLTLFVLDSKMQERARLDIFDRVNSGSPINRQQMRNCLYSGPATRWLRDMAATAEFQETTGRTLANDRALKQMIDREFINHFCAFHVIGFRAYVEQYRGDMDGFLADALRALTKRSDLGEITEQFKRSMRNNFTAFGRHAFRKHASLTQGRSQLNMALFDCFSTLLVPYPTALVEQRREALERGFQALTAQGEFASSISHSTNAKVAVERRFTATEAMLKETLGDVVLP